MTHTVNYPETPDNSTPAAPIQYGVGTGDDRFFTPLRALAEKLAPGEPLSALVPLALLDALSAGRRLIELLREGRVGRTTEQRLTRSGRRALVHRARTSSPRTRQGAA